jgi:hypothetical protein
MRIAGWVALKRNMVGVNAVAGNLLLYMRTKFNKEKNTTEVVNTSKTPEYFILRIAKFAHGVR